MTFVFDRGERIDTGRHGETRYVFANGNPVPNNGRSDFVYESDTGLGAASDKLRLTLFNEAGEELDSITREDDKYDSGAFGFNNGFEGNGDAYDYIRIDNGSTVEVVDDFEDGDISEYEGEKSEFKVNSKHVKNGDNSLFINPPSFQFMYSDSGLNRYPARGDTIRWWVYTEGGQDRKAALVVGTSASTSLDTGYEVGFGVNGRPIIKELSEKTAVKGDNFNQDGQWWQFRFDWG